MNRQASYQQLVAQESELTRQAAAHYVAAHELELQRIAVRQQRTALEPAIPVQFRLLLQHFAEQTPVPFYADELFFTLDEAEMNRRWLTYVLVLCANLKVDREFHPTLAKPFDAAVHLFQQALHSEPWTRQPYQVEIPLLNYINQSEHPTGSREIARTVSAFSHCLDPNWGASWIRYGFKYAQAQLKGYRKIVRAQAAILTVLP